jgi:predicted dehydrogenase
MTLRVAIVGMGNIGNIHARCYTDNALSRVVAVCDIIRERADKASADYGCPAFYSIQDMIASGIAIDCASMCTAGVENGGDHYEATMELLRAKIPLLGEKPISNEVTKATRMVALAKKNKLRYGINLNHRFTPAANRAKAWIEKGRIGELNMINMKMWINNPNETSPHFHIRALHPHSIDVMRYFCGDVKSVQAFFGRGKTLEGKRRKCWSNLQVNMLFKNGIIGHLCGSYDAGAGFGLESCEITGHLGRIVIGEACEELTLSSRTTTETEHFHHLGGMTSFGETFASRIHDWLVQNKRDVAHGEVNASGADALRCQKIIEAAIQSWETRKIVDV